jgi:AraC-like DNA-binding protein
LSAACAVGIVSALSLRRCWNSMSSFEHIGNGRQNWSPRHCIPRHRHDRAYAAVVLSGTYEECGSRGRFRVGPGDVLLHSAFDAHLDRFQNRGAQILNLMITSAVPAAFSIGRVGDPDAIARVADRDPIEAGVRLRAQLCEARGASQDWPDLLATDLLRDPDCRLEIWARNHGLAAATISRGFGRVFGVTPASFRLEVRARCALALISGSDQPLACIAAATGFADQAHMSRATRALTGSPPSWWRRSNPFKTGRPQTA